nr:hypothetical protein [Tanacetum cinerariifolium]
MGIEESLNVTFDESLPKPKSSSSIEDDRIDEPIVQDLNRSPSLQVNVSNKGYPKSLKEARGHLIEQVIGESNEKTLRSSIAMCLIEVNSGADLVDVVTIGVPSFTGDDFTKETIHVEYEWRPPRCDLCKIFSHVNDDCPKRVVSPPIVTTSNVVNPTVEKTNDGLVKKEEECAPNKGVTNVGNAVKSSTMSKTTCTSSKNDNIITSNSYSTLNEEEDVENVYDETANLFSNIKPGRISSFTAAAG